MNIIILIFGVLTFVAVGLFNDLWRWNSTSQIWTWLTGSPGTNSFGIYGFLGVQSASNTPGSRNGHGMAMNPKTGSIFVFGGYGYGATSSGNLNDLWEWNPKTIIWTWMNGTLTHNSAGSYGTLGVAAPSNCPSGRQYMQLTVDTSKGVLYIFGGSHFDLIEFDCVDIFIKDIQGQ